MIKIIKWALMLPITLILLIVAVMALIGWSFGGHEPIDVKETRAYRFLQMFGLAAMVTMLAALLAYIPLAGFQFSDGVLTFRHHDRRRHRTTDSSVTGAEHDGTPGHQTQHRLPTTTDEPASA